MKKNRAFRAVLVVTLAFCMMAIAGCNSGGGSATSSSVSSTISSLGVSSSSSASSSASQLSSSQTPSNATAQDSKYHISTADFDFDVPEYWRGRVDWETGTTVDGRSRVVFFLPGTGKDANGYYECELLDLSVQNADDQKLGGDYLTQTTFFDAGGKTVCSTVTNWIAHVYDMGHHPEFVSHNVTDAQLRDLIDLASEGEYSLERAQSLQELAGDDMSYIAYHVRDSIVAPNINIH